MSPGTLLEGRADLGGLCSETLSSSRFFTSCRCWGLNSASDSPSRWWNNQFERWLKADGVSTVVSREKPLGGVFCLSVGVLSLKYRTIRMPEINTLLLWLMFGAWLILQWAPKRLCCCSGGFWSRMMSRWGSAVVVWDAETSWFPRGSQMLPFRRSDWFCGRVVALRAQWGITAVQRFWRLWSKDQVIIEAKEHFHQAGQWVETAFGAGSDEQLLVWECDENKQDTVWRCS